MLIQNCAALLTDTIGLMNDATGSNNCDEFRLSMYSVYLDHKRGSRPIAPDEYLELAERKYHTIYWQGKWTASKPDTSSEYYVGNERGE